MTLSQKSTVKRLMIYGLSYSDSLRITNEINRLLNKNGPEWVISRFKVMKVAFIKMLSHQDPEWTWIKTRSGLPSGPFRCIFHLGKPHKVLNTLMVYSSLISPKVTEKQWKKFYNSVTKVRKVPINLFDNFVFPFVRDRSYEFKFNDTRVSRMTLSHIRSPDISDKKFRTKDSTPKLVINSGNHLIARSFILKHFKGNENFPQWFRDSLQNNWRDVSSVHDGLDTKGVVGRISFLQEPGFKLRAIANPLPIFQILLDPLKSSLLETLRMVPNDFTHDQDEGVSYVQSLLKDNRKLSSIDLSDATNHLPLLDQINVLTYLFGKGNPFIQLFKDVSECGWHVSGPNGDDIIHWKTGQPLGLGPSFPSFALYHHFIMRYVISQVVGDLEPIYLLLQVISGKGKDGVFPYAIVGDDIVMDVKYSDTYIRTLELLECPISYDKCLFNADTAEFCSRIITSTKVIRSYKWKSVTDKSFIDFCKSFGPAILPLLRPKQRAIAMRIGEIPDTLGGPIGWNPDGKCLMQREAELWRLAEDLLDLQSDYDISVPQAEVHYELKKELSLIRFPHLSLSDVVHQDSSNSSFENFGPRQRFVKEYLFQVGHGASHKIAIHCATELYPLTGYTSYNMDEIERKTFDFVFPISSREDLLKDDRYIRKLYTLLFKD